MSIESMRKKYREQAKQTDAAMGSTYLGTSIKNYELGDDGKTPYKPLGSATALTPTLSPAQSKVSAVEDIWDRGSTSSGSKAASTAALAGQIRDLETRRQELESTRGAIHSGASDALTATPGAASGLGDINTELKQIKDQLKELEKIRPEFTLEESESKYKTYSNAEARIKEKYGSVESFVADLEARAKALEDQTAKLKALEAKYKSNPTEAVYAEYSKAFDAYTTASKDYQALYLDYQPLQQAWRDYENYDTAAQGKASTGKVLGKAAQAGILQFGSALWQTAALLAPGKDNFVDREAAKVTEDANKAAMEVKEATYNRGALVELGGEAAVAFVAALPQAIAAMMSSGVTLTTSPLLTGASAAPTMVGALARSIKSTLKNPSFWMSMSQTLGPDYNEAKAAGATNLEAAATAIIASSINAGIEIGGGIEKLGDAEGTLVERILKSGHEEGWEELLQGLVTGTVNKGIYDFDKPLASLTDAEAVIHPQRMAKDYGLGATVGMLMSGSVEGLQAGASAVANRAVNAALKQVDAKAPGVVNRVSPAASPEVQQVQAQAEVTQAQNPEAKVLDAATTMYLNLAENKGKNTLKKAANKADIVSRLIAGKKVEDGEINALNLTDAAYRNVFTQLTGVQFPKGSWSDVQILRNVARSAHDVAQTAKAQTQQTSAQPTQQAALQDIQQMTAEQILERAKEARTRANPEADKKAAKILAQARGEIGPDGEAMLSFNDFGQWYRGTKNPKASQQELARMYDMYLDDNQTLLYRGKRISKRQYKELMKSVPGGHALSPAELEQLWLDEMERQKQDGKDAIEHSAKKKKEANNERTDSVHGPGLSGQPDQRSRGQGRGVSQETRGAEGYEGNQGRPEASGRGQERGSGQNQKPQNHLRATKVKGVPLTEVLPSGYTDEMNSIVSQYEGTGVNVHFVVEGYPVDSEGHRADGITIRRADGRIDVYLQVVSDTNLNLRSKHELAHVAVMSDAATLEQAILALSDAMTEEELLNLVNAYLPMYGSAYANSEDLVGDLLEEIVCDAYANLNRAGAGAPKYHDAVAGVIEAQLQTFSASYGQEVTLTDDAGNLVVETDDQGHSRFSMSTYDESGRDILTQWMGRAVVNGDLTSQDADDIIKTMDLIYDICKEARESGEYAPFDAWSEAKVVVNEKGEPVFSVVKANGDYAMNLDFSLVCKKRRTLDAVLNELVKRGFVDNLALDETQIVKINDLIRSYGFEVACDLCFVDAKRYRQGKVADDFVKLYNDLVKSMIPKNSGLTAHYFNFGGSTLVENSGNGLHELPDNQLDFTRIEKILKTKGEKSVEYKVAMLLKTSPEDRKLTMRGDFLSTRGFDAVNRENPRVLKLFNSKKGSGGPKSAVSDVQYLNEVLTSKTFTPEKAYAVGGVRIQSFSDYVPRMIFDYVQMIADLAAKKLPAHAYTKEELFVKQFGLTGMKINMSLIPKVVDGGIAPGLDADGNYAWADESFDFEEAKRIQKAKGYSRNCGTIAVGVSDEHIRKLMADPEIRMVIPYHKSGLNPVVAKMNKIAAFKNYTDFQNTRRPNGKDGKKLDKKVAADKKLLAEMPDFNQTMRELGDPRAAAEKYVRWCEENNLLPKFDQFAYKQIDGVFVEKDGKKVVDENYYKLLEDFTVYDKGEYVGQTELKMTFPTDDSAFGSMKDLIKRGLKEDAILEGNRTEKVPEIADEIMKFSVGYWKPNLDSTEWDIVNYNVNNGRGTQLTAVDKMFFEKTKGKTLFGIYSTDDDTLLYASRGADAVREHQFVTRVKEEYDNGRIADTSAEGLRALGEALWMQFSTDSDHAGDVVASGGLRGSADVHGGQPRLYASTALRNVLENIFKKTRAGVSGNVTEQPTQASEESGAFSLDDYSVREILSMSDHRFGDLIDKITPEESDRFWDKVLSERESIIDEVFEKLNRVSELEKEQRAASIAENLPDELLLDDDFDIEDFAEEPEKIEILFRREGLGEDYVAPEKQAVMTEKRLDERIHDSSAGTNPDYARHYITRISPEDFIDLTVLSHELDRDVFDTTVTGDHGSVMGEWDYEGALRDSSAPPVLDVDVTTGKVIGHNGRHRIRALEMAGIESVEIEVELYEDGRPKKYGAKTLPELTISSQFDTKIGTRLFNVIPLNLAHRDEILTNYGEKAHADAKVKYSITPGTLENAVYIRDGHTSSGEVVNFIDLILDGKKKGETRNHKSLTRKWVGLAKDGMVYGRARFGDPIEITNKSPEYKDSYIAGTEYDLKDGESKYYYPVLETEDLRDNPRPVERHGNYGQYKYSITPEFEQWYLENYGGDKVTNAQLKRKLESLERRAKTSELKRTFDTETQDTAWKIHHKKELREQKREFDEKLNTERLVRYYALRDAVAEAKDVERAKAAIRHDADMANKDLQHRKDRMAEEIHKEGIVMAERRNAAKRLSVRTDAYKQKVVELKENAKLKRNAARAVLRDAKLAAKRRAEIEAKQGDVDTKRKSPKERSYLEKVRESAQVLRTLGRSAYRNFVNMAEAIDRFSKRQVSGMRAGTLVNILGGTSTTIERIFKNGLVNRAGDRIGDSMSDVFLCWDAAHKKVDEKMQALLQDFMLHLHNIDRMSFVAKAEQALHDFEEQHPWLRDMDNKELARLVSLSEKESVKLGKQEAQALAIEYSRLLKRRIEAKNKPIFADDNGNAVSASTSRVIVDQYLAENPWLEEKANGIYKWWDLFMREWAVGDTITEAEYTTMRETYPHYVPTYRADKNGVGGANFVGAGGATVSKAVKKAKGGFSEVLNIEDSFSNLVNKIVRQNRVNELYMNIIDTAMLDEGGLFSDMAFFDWDWQDGAYGTSLLTGSADIEDLTDTVEKVEKAGLEKLGADYKLTGWRDGRQYTAFISEDMYKSIGAVTGHLANDLEKNLLKAGNVLTGPMKTAITGINPSFALRNISRDLPTAIVNSISGMAFPQYYTRGLLEMKGNSENWQRFQALGGTHATYYNDTQGFAKSIAKGKNIFARSFDKMGWFNEVTEAQTRFAEYLATIDRLGDTYENRLQGIKNSAEVTVDFSRKGRYGKVINAWVPYWNPAVQGIDKTLRSVIQSPDGSAIWKQASKTLGRAAMTTVLFEAIQYAVLAALDRDDEWEQLDDRTKATYYCIPLRHEKRFLKIPKTREWGAILGTPFMHMLEWANGREDPFVNYIETAIKPNFLPPAVLRLDDDGLTTDAIGFSQKQDIDRNEDFAGRAIVPYAYTQGTKAEQYDSETSVISKALSDLIGNRLSPMQIDYIIGDYFGDFGDLFIMVSAKATYTGDKNFVETVRDIITSPFTVDARYSNANVSKYYDMVDQLERVVQDKKNQLGTEEAQKTVEYQTQKGLETMYGKEISELNRYVRGLPDGEEKDAAKSDIAALAAEALEFYEDSMAGRIENPIRTAEYADLNGVVSAELIRLDELSSDYGFRPTGDADKSYTDPKDKQKEYILTEDQRDYFESLYRETYDEMMLRMIQSTKYKNTKDDKKKAEMLAELRKEVLKATKEEFFDWLKASGVRSTKKQK